MRVYHQTLLELLPSKSSRILSSRYKNLVSFCRTNSVQQRLVYLWKTVAKSPITNRNTHHPSPSKPSQLPSNIPHPHARFRRHLLRLLIAFLSKNGSHRLRRRFQRGARIILLREFKLETCTNTRRWIKDNASKKLPPDTYLRRELYLNPFLGETGKRILLHRKTKFRLLRLFFRVVIRFRRIWAWVRWNTGKGEKMYLSFKEKWRLTF